MLWLWLVRLLNSHSIEGGGTQPLVSIEGTCLVLSSVLFSCVIVRVILLLWTWFASQITDAYLFEVSTSNTEKNLSQREYIREWALLSEMLPVFLRK